jgi:AcrR family transcriptional regulator
MPRSLDDPRSAVLDAAERLLMRFGYHRMTVDDLAREAGIGKGTVYLHFDSKEEVALAVVDRWSERVFDRLRLLAAEPRPAAQRLLRMLEARVLGRFDQLVDAPESMHDMFAAIRRALIVQRERQLEVEARIFAAVLRELIPGAPRSDARPLDAARALLTGTNWLLPYHQDPSRRDARADLRRRTRSVSLLLVSGARQVLRARETPRGSTAAQRSRARQ